MISEKEKNLQTICNTEAPSCPYSFPSFAAAKLKLYPCLQAAGSQRDDAVFECSWHRKKCVVLSSSMIHMSTTAISPGFAHKEINSVNCALFAFLSLSEDQPSYLNTHVATLICREASSSSSQVVVVRCITAWYWY